MNFRLKIEDFGLKIGKPASLPIESSRGLEGQPEILNREPKIPNLLEIHFD
jgi:hypothetical protein